MNKNNFIIISSYALLAYYSIRLPDPSAFVFMMGLLLELIIITFAYFAVGYRLKIRVIRSNAISFLLTSSPFFLFHYFVAWNLTGSGSVIRDFKEFGLWYPLWGYWDILIITVFGLLLGYYFDVVNVVKTKFPQYIVEHAIVTHVFRIWLVGWVGIIFAAIDLHGGDRKISSTTVAAMLTTRILVELIAARNLKKLLAKEMKKK